MSFSDLPFELRVMIWELVLPDKKQEICIPWPLQEEAPPDAFIRPPRSPRKFLEPFLVDTDFPVLMHVCRESRGFAIARTRFRYSLVAGCPVPFRAFDPDLDIMYYSRCRPPIGPDDYKWGDFPRTLKHLAVDVHTLRDGSYFSEAFCQHFHLRTITCILPAPGAIVLTSARFRPPYRRCRLRPVEQPTADGSQSHFIHVDSGNYRRLCSISRFLEEVRDHIDDGFLSYIRDDGLIHPNFRPRWNAEGQRYDFELDAAMFEEYRGGSWDLSSKHRVRFDAQYVRFPDERVAIQRVKSYKVSEEEKWTPLRNPETFRVNDIQQDEVEFETESSEDIHMGMAKLGV